MHRHHHPALPYVALAASVVATGALWFSLSGLSLQVEQSTASAATPTPTATAEATPTPSPTLPPCPTEDSDNCYWDAQTMGNGEGQSFVTQDGETTYVDEQPTADDEPWVREPVEPWVQPCTSWLADNHIDLPCTGEPVDWPFSNAETLVCGPDAKPAIDFREDVGYWAYCEPALVP